MAENISANDDWMVRPCYIYREEYNECKSMKARFQQHFIYGESADCSQWQKDLMNCVLWKDEGDEKALAEVIQSEKARRLKRLKPHYTNKVWTRRKDPPSDWNSPLPAWMEKDFEGSYLQQRSLQLKSQEGSASPPERKMCIIS